MVTSTQAIDSDWNRAEEQLLAAVPYGLRSEIHLLLVDPRRGGRGLRSFVRLLVDEGRRLPAQLPAELIDVYLHDNEAEPLHDCEACGLPVPVRTSRRAGHEPNPELIYFPSCPHCGGRVGRFAYWSRINRAGIPEVREII